MANQQSDDINVFFPKSLTQLICNYVPFCTCGCHPQPLVGCEIPSLCGVEDCVRCGECKIEVVCKACGSVLRCLLHLNECTFCDDVICGGCVELYKRWNFPDICTHCVRYDNICKFCGNITVDVLTQGCFLCGNAICSQCVTQQQTDTSPVCISCQYQLEDMRRCALGEI
jgi:hypothetical protein